MSAPKPRTGVASDPVLAALENAPLDPDGLTPEEAAELEARIAKGSGRGRNSEEVFAALAACANPLSNAKRRTHG